MNYICFYCSPCNDGEMAKNIWKYKYPKTIFFPWIYSNELDNVKFLRRYKNEYIVFLNYCPKSEYLNNNNKYLIIDHHQNAINKISENENIKMYCDTKRSSCMLTWDYLYPNTQYPISVFHIGNATIGHFNNYDTEPFSLSFKNAKLHYFNLINLKEDDTIYKKIIIEGKKKMENYKFESLTFFFTYIIEYEYINNKKIKIVSVYCDKYYLYNYLIELAKIKFKDCNVLKIKRSTGFQDIFSIKSLDGTPVDIIARKYGGNGHKLAAGYYELID